MKKWKVLKSKIAFDNRWMMVRQDKVELPDGKILDDYFIFEEGHVSLIVPILKDGRLVFVKQYKHAYKDVVIEFPAGYIDGDETPLDAATRELKEETGLACDKLEHLATIINNPSKVVNDIHVFIAENAEEKYDQKAFQDDDENIELVKVSVDEAHTMIKEGKIIVTSTIASFYLMAEKLNKLP